MNQAIDGGMEIGRQTIQEVKVKIQEGSAALRYLKWTLILFSIAIILLIGFAITWKFRFAFTLISTGLRLGGRFGQMIAHLLFKSQDKSRKELQIAAVEMKTMPSAPCDPLEERAYVLDFIPNVCAIRRKKMRCYVEVLLNGIPQKALIDCGADITYCGESTAKKCNLELQHGDLPIAMAANQTPIPFLGFSETEMDFGDQKFKCRMLISKDQMCPGGLIIGTDLMEKHERLILDFKSSTIRIGDALAPMIAFVEANEEELNAKPIEIRILSDQTLPPLSDTFLWGYADATPTTNAEFLVEEWPRHQYWPVKVGKTLVKTNGRAIPIRMLNFGQVPCRLYAKSRIAYLEPICTENKINSIECFQSQPEEVSIEADWESNLPKLPDLDGKDDVFKQLNFSGSILSHEGKQEIKCMVQKHPEAFVQADGNIGVYKGKIVHKIELESGTRPIQQRPYPIPHAKREEVEKQVKEMLRQEIIRPSASAWASPIVLVRKADGKSWRFAVDYRALNKCTKKQTYLLPRIQDLIDVVGGKRMFSIFDLMSGFHQVSMHRSSIDKTAFITHFGLYEYLRMPFGLVGAPHRFQQVMEEIRHQLSASFLVYLDDVILGSNTETEHLRDLENFLKVMCEAGLKLRADKCRWGCGEIRYLGFLLSEKGVQIDKTDLEPILKLKKPESLTELRSLIGMFSYFRRFVRDFAQLMAPIYELTKKESTSGWNEEHDQILEEIKMRLTTAPILAPPKLGLPFTVETDASITAIGACLLQEGKDKLLHPIAYFSRCLNKHEKNYAVVELEALAIVSALKQFRVYLEGAGTSTVITDNSALTSLFRRKDLEGRLARYQMALQAYDLKIIYRPGPLNKVGDFLSRYARKPENTATTNTIGTIQLNAKTSMIEMMEAQEADREIQKIRKELIQNENAKENKFCLWKNLICTKINDEMKILVPTKLRKKIIDDFHVDPLQGAHLGVSRTLVKIRKIFHWDGMPKDVGETIKACETCQRRKIIGKHMSREAICPIEPANRPFGRVHVDLMGKIKKSRGFQYVMVAVDAFSKWTITIPLREQTTSIVCDAFIKHIVCQFGVPNVVVTDRGSQFTSETFQDLAKTLGFSHMPTTAYHQSANGQVERQNRTLADMLATSTKDGNNWDEMLPLVTFAYNTSFNPQTRQSPFFILHGFEAKLPSELMMPQDEVMYNDMALYVQDLMEKMQMVRQSVKENLSKNVETMKSNQKSVNPLKWTVGALILLRKVGRNKKFADKYIGPYRIIEIRKPNLMLKNPNDEDEDPFEVHMDRCKPFHDKNENYESNRTNEQSNQLKFADKNIESSEDEGQTNLLKRANEDGAKIAEFDSDFNLSDYDDFHINTIFTVPSRKQEFVQTIHDDEIIRERNKWLKEKDQQNQAQSRRVCKANSEYVLSVCATNQGQGQHVQNINQKCIEETSCVSIFERMEAEACADSTLNFQILVQKFKNMEEYSPSMPTPPSPEIIPLEKYQQQQHVAHKPWMHQREVIMNGEFEHSKRSRWDDPDARKETKELTIKKAEIEAAIKAKIVETKSKQKLISPQQQQQLSLDDRLRQLLKTLEVPPPKMEKPMSSEQARQKQPMEKHEQLKVQQQQKQQATAALVLPTHLGAPPQLPVQQKQQQHQQQKQQSEIDFGQKNWAKSLWIQGRASVTDEELSNTVREREEKRRKKDDWIQAQQQEERAKRQQIKEENAPLPWHKFTPYPKRSRRFEYSISPIRRPKQAAAAPPAAKSAAPAPAPTQQKPAAPQSAAPAAQKPQQQPPKQQQASSEEEEEEEEEDVLPVRTQQVRMVVTSSAGGGATAGGAVENAVDALATAAPAQQQQPAPGGAVVMSAGSAEAAMEAARQRLQEAIEKAQAEVLRLQEEARARAEATRQEQQQQAQEAQKQAAEQARVQAEQQRQQLKAQQQQKEQQQQQERHKEKAESERMKWKEEAQKAKQIMEERKKEEFKIKKEEEKQKRREEIKRKLEERLEEEKREAAAREAETNRYWRKSVQEPTLENLFNMTKEEESEQKRKAKEEKRMKKKDTKRAEKDGRKAKENQNEMDVDFSGIVEVANEMHQEEERKFVEGKNLKKANTEAKKEANAKKKADEEARKKTEADAKKKANEDTVQEKQLEEEQKQKLAKPKPVPEAKTAETEAIGPEERKRKPWESTSDEELIQIFEADARQKGQQLLKPDQFDVIEMQTQTIATQTYIRMIDLEIFNV